jgi:spore coat protein U-like protein
MRIRLAPAVLLCAMCAPGAALGAGCSVSSSGLAFGRYQPLTFETRLLSLTVTSDAMISVSCTGIVNGGAYAISLGPSLTGDGDRISTRYMNNAAGGPAMTFNVYRDPAYTSVWGDGITAGATLGGTIAPGDSHLTHNVYGRIPAGQNTLWPGTFSTTMTMTISYTP